MLVGIAYCYLAVEIRLHEIIKESLKNNPLEKKIADPKLGPIVYR